MKLKSPPLGALTSVALLGSAALSQAELSTGDLIGVTFGQTVVTTTMSDEAVVGASGDQWNNLRFNGSVNALGSVGLNDTTGASSGVSLAVSTGDGSGNDANAGLDLYDGNMFLSPGNAGPATITISGLGAGVTIDLYLYAGAGHTAGEGATFNFGSDKSAADPDVAESTYAEGANYVLFSGLVADGSGTISGTWSRNSGSDYSAFSGMQIAVSATPPPSPTASGTWTSTTGGPWDTAGNWSGDIVATGSGSTADFNTLNIPGDTTVDLDSARTIGNLVFGDTDTSSAAGWTLANNSVPANILTLAGTTPTITVNALGDTKTATISAVVAGSAGLAKAGTGTLTLSAANTYTGLTSVSIGTLQLQGGAFSTTARDYTIASGAVLNLDGNTGVASGTTTLDGTGTLRITGGAFANESPNVNIGPGRSISMEMDSGAVIDVQSGATMTNGGWQAITWSSNLASLNMDGSFDLWDGNPVIVDALTGAGSVGGGGTQQLTIGVDGGSGTFSGVVSGNIGITKSGAGTQTLSGTISYGGSTTVEDGTLSIGNGGGPTTLSDSATVSIASGATMHLNFTGSDTVGALEIAGSGSLPAGPYNSSHPTYGSYFTGSGTLVVPETATPYEIWANSFDPAIGLPAADDDNDGVTNQEEFAFGLLPNSGSSVNPITSTLDKTDGTFSYTRRSDSGLNYSVWYSENLDGWTEDTGVTEGTPVPSGDNESVEVTLSVDPLPAKLFIQVRAD